MNLHDKHIVRAQDRTWTYAVIPNHKPSRWMSNELGGYRITFTSLFQNQVEKGRIGKSETLTVRSASLEELRDTIEAMFPSAVFTNLMQDDLKVNFARQMAKEKAKEQAASEKREFQQRYDESYDGIVRNLKPGEQDQAFDEAVHEFSSNPEFSNPGWVEKFRRLPNFMSYPDNSWKNKEILKAFCKERGWVVPQAAQLAESFNKLFAAGCFYLQPSYKRSEAHIKNAVKPFSPDLARKPVVSEETIREAVRRLSAKFGVPFSVSIERLEAVGIPNAQEVFDALQVRYNPQVQGIENLSAKELKENLNRMRPPVDPRIRERGRW